MFMYNLTLEDKMYTNILMLINSYTEKPYWYCLISIDIV